MNSVLQQIDDLKAQWVAAQPLSEAKHEELWRKFRLEWNYNSNHIEGNTLTYGETELLLIMGQTKGDHTIREYDEMKAHDTAVAKIADMARAGDIFRETDVRDLNKIILKEPYWTEAVTESGQPTSVEIIPGDYKRFPNNVKSPTGEPILFASPADTPAQVAELVGWMQGELQTPTLHPLAFAALLHHRFLKIHPFADGNGRVARLLANYVILRAGFPPLIVKSKDKAAYIAALRVADVGEPQPLTNYFAQQMLWSLDIALHAARGESIEEPDDFDKEVSVFVKSVGSLPEARRLAPDTVLATYEISLKPLFAKLERRVAQLQPLFMEINRTFPGQPAVVDADVYFNWIAEAASQHPGFEGAIGFALKGLKAVPGTEKNYSVMLHFRMGEYAYKLFHNGGELHAASYGEGIGPEQIDQITLRVFEPVFQQIKSDIATSKEKPSS